MEPQGKCLGLLQTTSTQLIMKAYNLIIFAAVGLLSSCSSKRAAVVEKSTEVMVEHHIEIVHDTVEVTLPRQVAERIAPADSLSVLETDYAVSEARLLPDGLLRHTLCHKPTPLRAEVALQHERTDSIVARTTEVPVYIPRNPSLSDILRSPAFLPLLLLATLSLTLLLRKLLPSRSP